MPQYVECRGVDFWRQHFGAKIQLGATHVLHAKIEKCSQILSI